MNVDYNLSQPAQKKQDNKKQDNTVWTYLRHPSGRIHKIHPRERDCILKLIEWGWTRIVASKHN